MKERKKAKRSEKKDVSPQFFRAVKIKQPNVFLKTAELFVNKFFLRLEQINYDLILLNKY